MLQLVPNPSIPPLLAFCADPSPATLLMLKQIPAVYEAVQYDYSEHTHFGTDIIGVCLWLARRAEGVLNSLIQHDSPSPDGLSRPVEDWRTVGSPFFNSRKIID